MPLRPRRTREKKESKLLVCHDMMGGYTPQDKWPQGNMEEADLFRIYDWHLIDVFVYFSHNLVTIPPSPWTNCAHRNGTKCLGTFIAEWDEGVERCARIFESVATARRFADKLVAIASYYRFDGWLVNIENGLGRAQVAVLKAFLEHLTAQIHAAIPGSEVIWYDGVNKDGVVQHQNMLNSLNQPFFDLTDGIFLNYWHVAPAAPAAPRHASVAPPPHTHTHTHIHTHVRARRQARRHSTTHTHLWSIGCR